MAGAVNSTIGTTAQPGGTWTIQNTNTASVGRFHDLAFLLEGASGFSQARTGVLSGSSDPSGTIPVGMFCSVTGSGLNMTLRPGAAVVERSVLVGPYAVVSEASAPVTLATADPTNPRIDRVDLQVLDGALGDNSGTSLTQFIVTTGVAAGSPAVPAAPSNSIPICQIALPAGTVTLTNGMLTDKRKSTALRGGVRRLNRGDLLTDAGFVPGEMRDTSVIQTPGWIDIWDNVAGVWRHLSPTNGTGDTLIAGQIRTSSLATSGTTELQVMTTGALALEAASVYKVTFQSVGGMNSATVERWAQRLRKTNVGGTQLTVSVISPATNASQPIGQLLTFLYVTTVTETTTFVGTIARLTSNSAGNTWTVSAADTFILCEYVGPSSFFTTA